MKNLSILFISLTIFICGCSSNDDDTPPPVLVKPVESKPSAPTQFTLTVTVGEGGSVSTEGGTYDEGTEVTITATPEESYEFVGWEGNDSESNSINVILNSNLTLSPIFRKIFNEINIEIQGQGNYIVHEISYNLFKIIAEPSSGWVFKGWNGSFGESLNQIILINPIENPNLQLLFEESIDLNEVFGVNKHEQVFNSLKTLSSDWIQSDVNNTNQLFMDFSSVETKNWTLLFDTFFKENKLTSQLWNYLQYPTFYWLGDEVNLKLQNSLYKSLLKKLVSIENINIESKEEVFNLIKSVGTFFQKLKEDNFIDSELHQINKYYSEILIKSHENIFDFNYALSQSEINLLGDIKAQLYYNLCSSNFINPMQSPTLDEIIGFENSGIEYQIYTNHNVLVYHNNFFSSKSLNLIEEVFQNVPREYHNVVAFTHSGWITNPHHFSTIGGFNVFEYNTNDSNPTNIENGFPEDVPPFNCDIFYLVFVHELNHNVDATKIDNDTELKSHKDLLIQNAGEDQINYLRSIFDQGFFTEKPQEFIASISNMYFANSKLTFDVALKRAQTGNFNPIDQFLFFARFYSTNNKVKFFNYSSIGPLLIDEFNCSKNSDGYINSLTVNGIEYSFTLDQNNLVTGIN
tara:strand:- start:1063 stop:2958 length:1896 start_codon:yes stop_codon:yes gene_type:complete